MKAELRFDFSEGVHYIVIDGLELRTNCNQVNQPGGLVEVTAKLTTIRNVINATNRKVTDWMIHAEGDGFYVWVKEGTYLVTVAKTPPTCASGWVNLDALLKARGVSL